MTFGSNSSIGEDSLISRASPCGSPSTMSMRTTSASPFSTTRIAVVWPTNPLPTMVTRMSGLKLCDDRVGDLRRADGGWVVAARLHVVGHRLPFGDHGRDRGLQPVRCLRLPQTSVHQDAGEHHGHGVRLVHPLVLQCAPVRALEHGRLLPDVRAGRYTEAADEAGAQVGDDVAVQV